MFLKSVFLKSICTLEDLKIDVMNDLSVIPNGSSTVYRSTTNLRLSIAIFCYGSGRGGNVTMRQRKEAAFARAWFALACGLLLLSATIKRAGAVSQEAAAQPRDDRKPNRFDLAREAREAFVVPQGD